MGPPVLYGTLHLVHIRFHYITIPAPRLLHGCVDAPIDQLTRNGPHRPHKGTHYPRGGLRLLCTELHQSGK
jgi:hypothetical protein